MHLSQTTQYAVRALLHIAARAPATVRAGELTGPVGAPANYLAKTLHQLVRAGILASSRGPSGGFRLAIPADAISLERVASLFTVSGEEMCLLGGGRCGANPDCVVHQRWRHVAQPMDAFFRTTTIASLHADARPSAGSSQSVVADPTLEDTLNA